MITFNLFVALALAASPELCAPPVCSCEAHGCALTALDHAEAVFVGRVLEVRLATDDDEPTRGIVVTLLALQRWKGPAQDTLVIEDDAGSCRFGFEVGYDYLVVCLP